MTPETPSKKQREKRWPQIEQVGSSLKSLILPFFGFLLLLLPLTLPYFFSALNWQTTPVKFSGMLLQLTGLASVMLGLSRSREAFGERGLWRGLGYFWQKLRSIASPPEVRSFGVRESATPATSVFKAYSPFVSASTILEERLKNLEQRLADTDRRLKETRKAVEEKSQNLIEKISTEQQERTARDKEIEVLVKEAVIGGIHLEASGALYIAAGIVLTTFPEAIATLLY